MAVALIISASEEQPYRLSVSVSVSVSLSSIIFCFFLSLPLRFHPQAWPSPLIIPSPFFSLSKNSINALLHSPSSTLSSSLFFSSVIIPSSLFLSVSLPAFHAKHCLHSKLFVYNYLSMDVWDQQLQLPQDRHGRHRRQNPSFSSSLLDAIYRSIDESNGVEGEEKVILYRETMRKKQSIAMKEDEDDRLNFRRACMIEKWMEKKVSEKVVVRKSSMADFDRKARNVRDRDNRDRRDLRDRDFKKLMNSSSSSSESSSGGGFSSSESESRSSSYTMHRPRPIRTEKAEFDGHSDEIKFSIPNQKPKHENGFVKTKSKALRIYGDLKKVKQPISPGGRLATFLNSLFNGGSPRKQKFTNSSKQTDACMRKSKSTQGSTCSSASSFSRSCLSKTPSNGEKLINNGSTKRSVRFCLDEDSRPCEHKSLQDKLGLMAAATTMRNVLRNDHCLEEEASADLMNSYQKKINGDVYINRVVENEDEDEEDDDEDDEEDDEDAVSSCSSSDLFELDNLSSIGIQRYREELPVYETTHFTTNQAIANGLIL